TLAEVAKVLNPSFHLNIEVVPLVGGVDDKGRDIHSNEVARRVSEAFGGRYYVLNAPVIVNNLVAKKALEREKSIKAVIEKAKSANMAVVGIGIPKPNSTMVKRGYFSAKEFAELSKKGAVGDICTNFYDIQGDICEFSLDDKRIGLGLKELKLIPNVIGIASGEEKAEAILGALRGGYINMLVTNKRVAEYLTKVI
ncbi:sugar-binding transcriptional regulator, partial [Candidatus Aerophobetes bacterium]|nr:sugar-binding transcriptional regulator [Candidatus Aerophobetes bacterium]